MSFPAVLPSPARGVPAIRRRMPERLRRFLMTGIAAEPSDLPARITVGTIVASKLPLLLSTLLGASSLLYDPRYLWFSMRVLWPVSTILLTTGLLSRSRTARFMAIVGTSSYVVGSLLAPEFGLPLPVAAGIVMAGLVATKCALGVWCARALRRWVVRGAVEGSVGE